MDKDTWSYTLSSEPALFADRGFTAHEHLDDFDLVNMNGRLYDPVVGRFLSPDNYVQVQNSTQSYNRYSYCLNNPLKYVDKNGELFKELLGLFGIITSPLNFLGRLLSGDNLKEAWQGVGNDIEDFWNTGKSMDNSIFGGIAVLIQQLPDNLEVLVHHTQSQLMGQHIVDIILMILRVW